VLNANCIAALTLCICLVPKLAASLIFAAFINIIIKMQQETL
jgi:hypothetical protein